MAGMFFYGVTIFSLLCYFGCLCGLGAVGKMSSLWRAIPVYRANPRRVLAMAPKHSFVLNAGRIAGFGEVFSKHTYSERVFVEKAEEAIARTNGGVVTCFHSTPYALYTMISGGQITSLLGGTKDIVDCCSPSWELMELKHFGLGRREGIGGAVDVETASQHSFLC